MIVAVVAGTLSFLRLGRAEDPAITIRTMIVAAAWPGATVEETLKQVTERLERTLQETPLPATRVRSYTTAGQTTIFVDLEQSAPPAAIPDVWYQVRKNVGDMRRHAAAGRGRPVLQRRLRRHLRHHLRVHRRRLHVPRAARLRRGRALAPAAGARTSSKIEVLGAQDEQVFIEFSTERLAGPAPRLPDHRRDAAGAEPRAPGRRHPDRRRSACSSASPARSRPSATSRTSTSWPATASSASATSRRCGAASSTRRSRCSASTASRRSASRSRCATPATSWRSGRTCATEMADIRADLPDRHRARAGRRPGGHRSTSRSATS